jgi:hypothetical protein
MSKINKVKAQLKERYKMKDLGPVSFFLGIKVERDWENKTIRLTQRAYIESFLKNLVMWQVTTKKTPMEEKCQLNKAAEGAEATLEAKLMYQSAGAAAG